MVAPGRRGTTNVQISPDNYLPQDILRLSRLGRELRLTDQILAIDVTTVTIVESGPAPAWTSLDGDQISFSLRHMPLPLSRVDIMVWLGTNAHELGHSLFSPRKDSVLMQRLMEADRLFIKGVMQLHNIVEDQREERLLIAKFRPWSNYLVAALGHHLKVRGPGAWLLMAGRTWLSDQVRQSARTLFVQERGESTAKDVARLVGEYQRLTDPGDTEAEEAFRILEELHTLFDLDIPDGGCGGGVLVNGEPDTNPDDSGAPPTADEPGDQQSEGAGGKGDGDESKPDDTGTDESGKDSDKADGESGASAGSGGKPPSNQPFTRDRAKKQMKEDAQRGAQVNPEAKADLDSILDALNNGREGGNEVDGDPPEGRYRDATDTARLLRREVEEALLEFKEEAEPGWVKGTNSGRINVRRLLNPRIDPETLFDRYEPGQMEATDLECIAIVDVSGSMTKHMRELGEAIYAVRHAIDDIEGTLTVFTFCSGPHRVLCRPGERPDSRMFVPKAWGGTNPESALRDTFQLLADSRARCRLLIIFTDGDWYGDGGDRVVEGLRAVGVTTAMAYLPFAEDVMPGFQPSTHGIEFYYQIDNISDLAILFRDVALARMREA